MSKYSMINSELYMIKSIIEQPFRRIRKRVKMHRLTCLKVALSNRYDYSLFKINAMAIIVIALTLLFPAAKSYGQDSDSLNHYLEVAVQNNPAIKSALLSYEASLQRIPQVRALEDPKVDMGFFLKPMTTFGGKQLGQVQIMQMFPWFGTKKAAGTEAEHMAKMAFEQFREERDALYFQVYSQWFVLCNLQQKLLNSMENRKLLVQIEELALRRFSSGGAAPASVRDISTSATSSTSGTSTGSMGSSMGMASMSSSGSMNSMGSSGSMSGSAGSGGSMGGMSMGGSGNMGMNSSSGMADILQIQIEMAELDNNIESISSEIEAEKARFNILLNRPTSVGVVVPHAISIIPFHFDEEMIKELIKLQNPMLAMYNEEANAHDAMAEMNRKMGYPMFGIGIQYMLIGKSSNSMVMPDMNGNDMVMPMLSVSIPIFRKKYDSAQKESLLLKRASEENYLSTLNGLEAELYLSKHRLDDALRKIELYRKQATLTGTTYELVVREFAAGKGDLSSAIQIQRQLLDYQFKEAEAIAGYNTLVASVWKLISQEK